MNEQILKQIKDFQSAVFHFTLDVQSGKVSRTMTLNEIESKYHVEQYFRFIQHIDDKTFDAEIEYFLKMYNAKIQELGFKKELYVGFLPPKANDDTLNHIERILDVQRNAAAAKKANPYATQFDMEHVNEYQGDFNDFISTKTGGGKLKKTEEIFVMRGQKRVVYKGKHGKKYIKWQSKYVSLSEAKKTNMK